MTGEGTRGSSALLDPRLRSGHTVAVVGLLELDRFLEHLEDHPQRVTDPRRSQLASYARELRSVLAG